MKKQSAFVLLGLAMMILHPLPMLGSPSTADSLVYYLPFDDTAKAAKWVAGQPDPVAARGLTFVPGICGKAVYVGGHGNEDYANAPLLEYDAGKLFASPSGTVSFWVRPDWDGYFEDPQNFPWYFLLTVMGGKETPDFDSVDVGNNQYDRFTLFMWNWLRGDVAQKGGKPPVSLEWKCRPSWMKNDWWHVVFTWNEKKQARLYVNGLPRAGEVEPMLADSQRFFIGGCGRAWVKSSRANAAFDEFKIFNRALNEQEIRDEFRRLAPVDFSVERRYLRANTPEQVVVEVEPGAGAAAPVAGELQLRIVADADGRTVAERKTGLKLAQRESITLPSGTLSTGDYRLECVLKSERGCYQRGYALTVYQQEAGPTLSKDPVKLGDCIARVDCTQGSEGFHESAPSQIRNVLGVGSYREAGKNKADRYAFEIKIPNADGSPVMMEITWPDDRERSMGLYMIPRAESVQHRDRLSGGIQSGGEYPLSGATQKASYLFYPAESRYLFETRTMVTGLPAAVSKVEIYRIAERLPKLPIASPAGWPGRWLGHLDEDQSFDMLIAPPGDSRFPKSPLRWGYPIQALERLMDYFDYTGQNVMSYSLARYDWTHYDEGPINSPGSALLPPGGVMLMLDMFEKRNQYLIGNLNLYTAPAKPSAVGLGVEVPPAALEKRIQDGYFLFDRNGKPQMPPSGWKTDLGNNPLHPAIRSRLLEIVGEILRRYGKHPAFKGIDVWCNRGTSPFILNSLDYGYDDLTVGLFEKETGLAVPNIDQTTARFNRRYQYLTGEKRTEWIRWRTQKTTEMFREIDKMARATRLDLRLFLSPAGWLDYMSPGDLAKPQCERFDFATFAREQLSLDLEALKQLPSVILNPQPNITAYRWVKHWHGRESVFRELNANFDKFQVFRNGPRNALGLYLAYFESFIESLKQDTYKAYFQNADVKAHDRFFLEDYARGMAAVDPSVLTVGAQPLGSAGRDLEVREFAQAFRALPAGTYQDVAGLKDPVAVRQFQTSKGTYLYAVNLIWMTVGVTLKFDNDKATLADLSSGQSLKVSGGEATVSLKPFELRSLLAAGLTGQSNVTGRIVIPEETRRWYLQRVKELEEGVQAITENGGEVDPQKERLETIKTLLARNAYAEVHRLLFSKMIRELGEYKEYSAAGYYKDMKAMLARSQYAIGCGSARFYRAKSGQLFLPDNQYEPGGYGYEGNYLSIERSVAGLKGSDDPTLFAAEAYHLDAYRFTVKNGRYAVRMYFKVGYKPGAKPGVFVFNLDIENQRVLSDFDVFEAAGRDFDRVVVREFKDIEVKDGVLDIEFGMPTDIVTDPTVRMCNAIEVIPPSPGKSVEGTGGR